jgi:hypothetical protein
MRKNLLIAACILGLIPLTVPSTAQEPRAPFEGPPVAKMPSSCRYEVSLQTALEVARKKWEAENPDAPKLVRRHSHRIVKWVVSKTGKIAQVQTTDEGGKSGEFWVVDGAVIFKDRDSEAYWALLADEAGELEEISFGRDRFPHTHWIKSEYFRSKTKKNGKPALEFAFEKTGGQPDEDTESRASGEFFRAWIDDETRFPLVLEIHGDTYTFRHLPRPEEKLSPPEAVLAAYRREAERQRALNTPPPPP